MENVVIVSATRTPIGKFGGKLREVATDRLAAIAVREAVTRAGIKPEDVDEVILGHVLPNGEYPNIARLAALLADFPIEVPAYTLDRQCSSGLQAIINGVMQIQTGNAQVVVAGGVECMSNSEYYVTGARWGYRAGIQKFYDRFERAVQRVSCEERFGPIDGMIRTAENVANRYGISREAQDELALESHQRACKAIADGKFKEEIVPVIVPRRKGEPEIVDQDEHPRQNFTLEQLAKLKPLLGDTVTAGNASGMNDGAAACVLMSETKAKELGLKPMGRIKSWALAGVHPEVMGIGPGPAVKKVLAQTGLTLGDMDVVEINEAFASQALAVMQDLGIKERGKVNVNGSGISLGHPLGATGARILTSLLYEMARRDARYGLETMCIGGGMGLAAIIERI